MFDTLSYSKELEETGVPRNQAEVHARLMANLFSDKLATKDDLKDLRKDFKNEMKEMRYDIIFKLGAINVTMVTLAVAFLAAFFKLGR